MTKLLAAFCLALFCSCADQSTPNDNDPAKVESKDTASYKGLQGTWIRHNKEGFTLIEIKDTSNVWYYQFYDRKVDIDTITNSDRYWYYKSKAKMGHWSGTDGLYKANSDIWISTDKFRFDYKINGDTLIEYDKIGEQGKFVKVESDN